MNLRVCHHLHGKSALLGIGAAALLIGAVSGAAATAADREGLGTLRPDKGTMAARESSTSRPTRPWSVVAHPAAMRTAVAQAHLRAQSTAPIVLERRIDGTLSWLSGTFRVKGTSDAAAAAFLMRNRTEFGLLAGQLKLAGSTREASGGRNVYFEQQIDGVSVYGARLAVYFAGDGSIRVVNGEITTSSAPPRPTALMTSAEAVTRAVLAVGSSGTATRATGTAAADAAASLGTRFPRTHSELVYYPSSAGALSLCYLVRLGADDPPAYWLVFVDAASGKIHALIDDLQTAKAGPAIGKGTDLWGHKVTLRDYRNASGRYLLIDMSKYMYKRHQSRHINTKWQGVIEVRSSANKLDAQSQPVASTSNPAVMDPNRDNVFDDRGNRDAKTNYRAAVSLAAGFSKTYDFYRTQFGRNSLDDKGLSVIGNVHFGQKYANAYWTPEKKMMFFGDFGDGQWPASRGLDVIAHEYTHGVTNFSVPPDGLVYMGQSGALNDSLSDLFAAGVDYDDWTEGEDLGASPRYYDDPSKGNPSQPADMYSFLSMPLEVDNGGVHINSGILNHFLYVLSTSLPPVAPAHDGRFTALKVVYHSYTYLRAQPMASFADMARALAQSAIDLYGSGSQVHLATLAALEATHMLRAQVQSWDNGMCVDQAGQVYNFPLYASDLGSTDYFAVRFDQPSPTAMLKTVSAGFGVDPSMTGQYEVWLAGVAADGTPDEASVQLLARVGANSGSIRSDGMFTNFVLDTPVAVPAQYFIIVGYQGSTYSNGAMISDNGAQSSGRSYARLWWFDGYQYQSYWRPWTQISGLNNNFCIRTITTE